MNTARPEHYLWEIEEEFENACPDIKSHFPRIPEINLDVIRLRAGNERFIDRVMDSEKKN